MPIVPNFTAQESLSSNNLVTFTDTSTGTDLSLTNRKIYVRLANGNWLTAGGVQSPTSAYMDWSYSDASTTIDLLTNSTTANVTVEWYAGSALTYTKTILIEWDLYDYVFLFGLLSAQTSFPAVNANQGYWPNSFYMVTNLFQSEQAVELMDDLYSSQAALDRNQWLINNQNDYF